MRYIYWIIDLIKSITMYKRQKPPFQIDYGDKTYLVQGYYMRPDETWFRDEKDELHIKNAYLIEAKYPWGPWTKCKEIKGGELSL